MSTERTRKIPKRSLTIPDVDIDTPIYAIDYGKNRKLCVHGPDGSVSVKRLLSSAFHGDGTPSAQFPLVVEACLDRGADVVTESSTPRSSGADEQSLAVVVKNAPKGRGLYTLSCRCVKNHRLDFVNPRSSDGKWNETDEEAARILYEIASKQPMLLSSRLRTGRLKLWRPMEEEFVRYFTSVRPMDESGYNDEAANEWIDTLPPPGDLPSELHNSPLMHYGEYVRRLAIPWAMAMEEFRGIKNGGRNVFEKILGFYDHGYPSFYRRACVEWANEEAKKRCPSVTQTCIPREVRKGAYGVTTKLIRLFFHYCDMWDIYGYDAEFRGNKLFRVPVDHPPYSPLPARKLRG